MRRLGQILLVFGGVAVAAAAASEFTEIFSGDAEHHAIGYGSRTLRNAVSELNAKIEEGKVQLTPDGPAGYLRSTLAALNIPIESQMVVFSKTSLQRRLISPSNPRSIFFNDSVAAAWVRGEPFVELAVQDPQQGIVFYTLDQAPTGQPKFVRQEQCLQCHNSNAALGVPGMLVRSGFTANNGVALQQLGEFLTDHRSPFEERWGGWYVTGKVGGLKHMGNLMFGPIDPPKPVNQEVEVNSLEGTFESTGYLSQYSDIVALMVFNHQMHIMNLFTSAGWQVRIARYEENARSRRDRMEDPLIRGAAKEIADYLLFIDEAPLHGGVEGTSGFADEFAARGPNDNHGRSLRQFDLKRRLMSYPCSYMIYSEAFDGLPGELKEAAYQRMWEILSGKENEEKYTRLSFSDRHAIIEILRATKKGLPDYFQPISK